jgi:choline dehydrogenase
VVGAGSAGAALARRLAEAGRRVLVVEAGRDYGLLADYPGFLQRGYSLAGSLPGNPNGWFYRGVLTDRVTYPVTRGKVVGGSSAVNGGQFTRGLPADYDLWAAAGNDLWSYAAVLPYLVRMEHDLDFGAGNGHGDGGPVPVLRPAAAQLNAISGAFLQSCLDLGFPFDPDMNAPGSTGIGVLPHNVVDGLRVNTGVTYLDREPRPAGLALLDQALVERVLFDGDRAVGVLARRGGRALELQADEVVLAAGALNSPHLLMLSGIGPAATLAGLGIPVRVDAPGVGTGFMDHPAAQVMYRMRERLRPAHDQPSSQVCLNYTSAGSAHPDDARIFPYSYPKGGLLFGIPGTPLAERLRGSSYLRRPLSALRDLRGIDPRALLDDIRHRGDLAFYCGLDIASARGRLELTSASIDDPPVLHYRYLAEDDDRRRLRESVLLGRAILAQQPFRELGAEVLEPGPAACESDAELDDWLRAHLRTSYHTAGTAKMGPAGDPAAVVDQHCRVHGVRGLRVVDISIMPFLVRRGPNASAIMIGERAADLFD